METVVIEIEDAPAVDEHGATIGWGWFLAAGIAWIVIGLSILSANPISITIISYLVAAVLILAGILEIANAFVRSGWKWLHGLVGVAFAALGIMALFNPFQTFVGLSILFGWYLIIKGITVLTLGIAFRQPGSLWGLAVAVGIIDMLIGFWAIGYPGRSAWLLLLWIGFGAIVHGVAEIIGAFDLRSMQKGS